MSKLKQLINEMCPDGVEFIELDKLVKYEQPTKYIVKTTNYNPSYSIPVLTAGKSFVLGYTDEKNDVYKANSNNPVIIFDDFTTSFHWVDFKFKIKSSAMKILTNRDSTISIFRYILHAMKTIFYQPSTHSRQWISKYSKFTIPLPPLPIQEKIVRILDTFTELEAELEARNKQYEYYRNFLLNSKLSAMQPLNTIPRKVTLGSVAKISSGRNKKKQEIGKYPVYGSTGVIGYSDKAVYKGIRLLIARVGANCGLVQQVEGEYDVSDNTLMLTLNNQINYRYAFHLLTDMRLNQYSRGGGQPLLTAGQLKAFEIPVPPLSEQQRIVSILDKFDSLVNDISIGLPAEIEARRKQYEYYRDKLLTFKKKGSAV